MPVLFLWPLPPIWVDGEDATRTKTRLALSPAAFRVS